MIMKTLSRLALWAASLTVLALLAHPGRAADDKAVWTGCYGGAGLGVANAISTADAEVAGVGSILTVDGLGVSSTQWSLIAGCDVQMDRIVIGAFGDYAWHDGAWTVSSALLPGAIARLDMKTQWTLGGRVGVTAGNALAYGLIGYTKLHTSDLDVPVMPATFAVPDASGLVLGGGVELALGKGFFAGIEYRYSMLDTQRIALVPGALDLKLDTDIHAVQGRLTYKLGLDGVPSAK